MFSEVGATAPNGPAELVRGHNARTVYSGSTRVCPPFGTTQVVYSTALERKCRQVHGHHKPLATALVPPSPLHTRTGTVHTVVYALEVRTWIVAVLCAECAKRWTAEPSTKPTFSGCIFCATLYQKAHRLNRELTQRGGQLLGRTNTSKDQSMAQAPATTLKAPPILILDSSDDDDDDDTYMNTTKNGGITTSAHTASTGQVAVQRSSQSPLGHMHSAQYRRWLRGIAGDVEASVEHYHDEDSDSCADVDDYYDLWYSGKNVDEYDSQDSLIDNEPVEQGVAMCLGTSLGHGDSDSDSYSDISDTYSQLSATTTPTHSTLPCTQSGADADYHGHDTVTTLTNKAPSAPDSHTDPRTDVAKSAPKQTSIGMNNQLTHTNVKPAGTDLILMDLVSSDSESADDSSASSTSSEPWSPINTHNPSEDSYCAHCNDTQELTVEYVDRPDSMDVV